MGAATLVKVLVALGVIFLVLSFVWYPAFYSDYFPPAVADPVLQARSDLASLTGNLGSSISGSGAHGPNVNSSWAALFFAQLNQDRGSAGMLVPCSSLDSFAQLRFDDMSTGTNYEISHYNYGNDLRAHFQGSSGT